MVSLDVSCELWTRMLWILSLSPLHGSTFKGRYHLMWLITGNGESNDFKE